MLQLKVAFSLERGHSHQQLAQDGLLELLHLLGGEVGMHDELVLEMLHLGLEVLLQRVQGPLGLLDPFRAESS